VEDGYRDNKTGIAHNVVEKAEYSSEVTTLGNRLRLLLYEETEAVGQLRSLVRSQGVDDHEQATTYLREPLAQRILLVVDIIDVHVCNGPVVYFP
jgi:hypothetical protein